MIIGCGIIAIFLFTINFLGQFNHHNTNNKVYAQLIGLEAVIWFGIAVYCFK